MKTYHLRDFCEHPDFPLQILFRAGTEPERLPFHEKSHLHDFVEIIYVVSGSGWCAMDERRAPCFPGDLYIMPLKTVHEFRTLTSMRYYDLLIQKGAFTKAEHAVLKMNPSYSRIFSTHKEEPTFCRLPFPETSHLRSLLAMTLEYSDAENPFFKVEFKSCMLLVLCEIFRLISRADALMNQKEHRTESGMQLISKIADYMTRHFREQLTVHDLAEYAKMSQAGFIRFFHRETGIPPLQYLNQLRIFEACRLLREQKTGVSYSILEIAYMCGFNNPSYFTEMFRKIMDTTPSEYRLQNRFQ